MSFFSAGGGGGGAMQLVQTQVAAASTTTFQFTGLNSDTDGIYKIIFLTKNVSGGASRIDLYFNNDLTASNYNCQLVKNSVNTTTTSTENSPRISFLSAVNESARGEITIYHGIDKIPTAIGVSTSGTDTGITSYYHSMSKTGTIANITQINLSTSQATGFATSSTCSLYKIGR